MTCKVFHQLPPSFPIPRRRNVGTVPERMRRILCSHCAGHETQLDEWANAIFEKAIINLVDIRPVVDGLAVRIDAVHAVLIMKDGVKSYVLDTGGLLNGTQVAAIGLTKGEIGAARTVHLFPEVGEGFR